VRGACSEVGLSEKPQADPQEDGSLLAIAPITQTEERSTRIRLRSFIPRSRSKVVFALVMGCYCVTLGSFVSVWARVAHVPNPPRAFYLRGDAADIIALLVVAPILESLVLVEGSSWCAEYVLLQSLRYSLLHYSSVNYTFGPDGRTR